MRRRIATLLMAVMVALSVAAVPAFAGGYYPPPEPPHPSKSPCNAGNGNGSENCDPGKSAPQNKGGDEVPALCEGGSTPNPGGNNEPCL